MKDPTIEEFLSGRFGALDEEAMRSIGYHRRSSAGSHEVALRFVPEDELAQAVKGYYGARGGRTRRDVKRPVLIDHEDRVLYLTITENPRGGYTLLSIGSLCGAVPERSQVDVPTHAFG